MGYSEEQALTLGKAVAGTTAQFKGRTLGIYTAKEKEEAGKEHEEPREAEWIELMGRHIPITNEGDLIFAAAKDKAIDPDSVRRHLQEKYGESLAEVAATVTALPPKGGSFSGYARPNGPRYRLTGSCPT